MQVTFLGQGAANYLMNHKTVTELLKTAEEQLIDRLWLEPPNQNVGGAKTKRYINNFIELGLGLLEKKPPLKVYVAASMQGREAAGNRHGKLNRSLGLTANSWWSQTMTQPTGRSSSTRDVWEAMSMRTSSWT